MILTPEQNKELENAARPLVEWLCKNCGPHVVAIVKHGAVELSEGVCRILIEDYISD